MSEIGDSGDGEIDEQSESSKDNTGAAMLDAFGGEFRCQICNDPLIDACRINCGHLFCRFCVDQRVERASSSEESAECPVCSKKIKEIEKCPNIDADIDKLCSKLSTNQQLILVRKKAVRRNLEKELENSGGKKTEKRRHDEEENSSRPSTSTDNVGPSAASRTRNIAVLEPSHIHYHEGTEDPCPDEQDRDDEQYEPQAETVSENETSDSGSTPLVLHETITIHRTRIIDPNPDVFNAAPNLGTGGSGANPPNFYIHQSQPSLGGTYEYSYYPYNYNYQSQPQYLGCSFGNCTSVPNGNSNNLDPFAYPYCSNAGYHCQDCLPVLVQGPSSREQDLFSPNMEPNFESNSYSDSYSFPTSSDIPNQNGSHNQLNSTAEEYQIDVEYQEISQEPEEYEYEGGYEFQAELDVYTDEAHHGFAYSHSHIGPEEENQSQDYDDAAPSEYHYPNCSCSENTDFDSSSSDESISTSPRSCPCPSCWRTSSEDNAVQINLNLSYQSENYSSSSFDSDSGLQFQCVHLDHENGSGNEGAAAAAAAVANIWFNPPTTVTTTTAHEGQLEEANDPEFAEFLTTFHSMGLHNPLDVDATRRNEGGSEFTV